MIDWTTLITYIAIVLGFVFIPGPATLLTVARATSSGTKVGIATGAGVAAGDVIHTFMAIIGISAIIAASAALFTIVKYLGAAYLVFLGLQAILAKTPSDPTAARALPITAQRAFRQAILTEVLNPKTALFFLAFLPQFVRPENGAVALQLAVLGTVFVLLGLLSCVVFAVTSGGLGRFLRRHPTVLRWQGKIVGSIYCALGVRLALQER
ncbi:LysE family translocator [Afifella sp. IM 167]|uniref:LysE family translocator n=1 Tax=Afifella sp. IM 167 TaxID=2033586 RepID=UPI001CCD3506|nr:LysE family translocator [Afifella sp. IM 167]MBZ8133671.1 lysine transporter LysE [Afifella sp. IM 167]